MFDLKLVLRIAFLSLSLSASAKTQYPLIAMDRPFTMPQNSFESRLSFSNDKLIMLSVDYGVTTRLQAGLSWDGLDTGIMPARRISLNLAYFLFSTQYLSSSAGLLVPFHFNKMVVQEAQFGLPTHLHVVRGKVSFVFLEDFVTMKWWDETFADFNVSTRLSWQANPSLRFDLVSSAATFSTSGDHTTIIKATPIHFKVLYAVTPMVDAMGSIGFDDVPNALGFSTMLGIAIRGGSLEG